MSRIVQFLPAGRRLLVVAQIFPVAAAFAAAPEATQLIMAALEKIHQGMTEAGAKETDLQIVAVIYSLRQSGLVAVSGRNREPDEGEDSVYSVTAEAEGILDDPARAGSAVVAGVRTVPALFRCAGSSLQSLLDS